MAALLAIGRAALGAPIDPNNPPQGRFSDDWLEIYMGDNKIGYAHSAMTRRDDLVDTELEFHMVMGRVEQPVSIDMTQRVTEKVDGTPVNFSTEMNMSVMKSATRGTVRDGRVEIITSQFGMEQKQEFPFPKGALMSWGTFRESLLRGFRPGTEYVLDIYAPELRMDGAVKSTTRVGAREDFTHKGEKLSGQRMTVSIETSMGDMEMVSWIDEDGVPLKMKMPVPGMGDIVMVVTDQKTALAEFLPPEFFMKTVIKADRKIDFKKADRITYRVSMKDPNVPLGDLPETGSQGIVARSDKHVDVLVERQKHRKASDEATKRRSDEDDSSHEGAVDPSGDRRRSTDREREQGGAERGDAPDLAEYLSSNLMINTQDPKLIELARQAAGGESEPFALGDRLRRFVTDHVETKSLNVGFATASEVARTKEGDCSEHGVLLAALGRINGLPSRVVVGLAYVPVFGGQDDIFGYHMWTQFFIDGRWIDFDAALRETECSPIRIAFATSSLQDSGLADLSLPLITKLGAIDLKVLEIE